MTMERSRYVIGIATGLILAMAIIGATTFVSSGRVGGLSAGRASGPSNGAQVTTVYAVATSTLTATEAALPTSALSVSTTVSTSTTSSAAPNISSATSAMMTTTAVAVTTETASATAVQTPVATESSSTFSTTAGSQPSSASGGNASAGVQYVTTVITTATSVSTIHPSARGGNGLIADFGFAPSSSSPNNSPSSVRALLTSPTQSAIVLLPILLAVILGLVFFRASRSRDDS